MTELSGSLEGIGLVALVRFLSSVARSGRLVVRDAELLGRLDLDDGVLVGAVFDQERGMPALEAIALALAHARFDFRDANGPVDHNLRLAGEEVTEVLERLSQEQATLTAAVPSLAAVPHLVLEESTEDPQIELDRDTLRLLVRLDGRRTVADLARERGLLRTLRQLARLVQLKLVRVDAVAGLAPAAEPTLARAELERPAEEAADTGQVQPGTRPRPQAGEPAWSRWRRPADHQ